MTPQVYMAPDSSLEVWYRNDSPIASTEWICECGMFYRGSGKYRIYRLTDNKPESWGRVLLGEL